MQARLEDVLGDKERELKLYQRFLDLKSICEEDVFPSANIPLKQHAENLTSLIEKIIPDPRDRKEELFSGEIFTLLGAAYLHDAGLAGNCRWLTNEDIFSAFDVGHKRMLVSKGIGKELGIPEKAIEVINCLSFSNVAKKMPMEWVITEGGKKALIRNTKVIEHLFNFSHFILDVFYSDLGDTRLRRYQRPKLALGNKEVSVEISGREGIITIGYEATSPYEFHQIEKARNYVERAFKLFKDNVNGRLGFQYKEIKWNISRNFGSGGPFCEKRVFSPCAGEEVFLIERWTEASAILDRLFDNGSALVVGEESVGKSTLLKSFVLPQAAAILTNVFYCDVWTNPVHEVRDVICSTRKNCGYSGLDIISLCSRLLDEGPSLFILDGFERSIDLNLKEREKLERFLDFCFAREHCYLIISGDREAFFEWSALFSRTALSALYELKPLEGERAAGIYGSAKTQWDRRAWYTPMECELLEKGTTIEGALRNLLADADDVDELRPILAALIDMNQIYLRRHGVDEICFETHLSRTKVLYHLDVLTRKRLVARDEVSGSPLFSLASRSLREPLFRVLELRQFAEKKETREILTQSSLEDSLLDGRQLDLVRRWKDGMVFSKEGMGRILASLIGVGEDCGPFLEKAKHDNSGIDIQPILKFLRSESTAERERAIRLLLEVQDKNIVNPLLTRLKNETVPELKDLIIKGMWATGKKRRIIAVMRTLKENGDRDLRLRAIGFFHIFPPKTAKNLLADLMEAEDDPIVLEELRRLLPKQGT